MTAIVAGSILLSIVHAMIPNHWIPLVAIGRSEKWSRAETLSATAVAGIAHTASTILFGIVVGYLGLAITNRSEMFTAIVAPVVLVGLGIVFVVMDLRGGHHHHHGHDAAGKNGSRKSRVAIIASLSVAMFFSPCLEIEAYYFYAGREGWPAIAAVSLIYGVITVLGMVGLVWLALRGLERLNWHVMEHHEKAITGGILILLGIVAWVLEH